LTLKSDVVDELLLLTEGALRYFDSWGLMGVFWSSFFKSDGLLFVLEGVNCPSSEGDSKGNS